MWSFLFTAVIVTLSVLGLFLVCALIHDQIHNSTISNKLKEISAAKKAVKALKAAAVDQNMPECLRWLIKEVLSGKVMSYNEELTFQGKNGLYKFKPSVTYSGVFYITRRDTNEKFTYDEFLDRVAAARLQNEVGRLHRAYLDEHKAKDEEARRIAKINKHF